jgi:DNA adenine methylase
MIFRFPGGKHKFLPVLDALFDRVLDGANSFHDVFVGGGSVLLHVAKKRPNVTLHANDLDMDIASFWRVVVSDEVGELCERLRIRPTIDAFYQIRAQKLSSALDRAFRVIFLNRTAFSGLWHNNPIGGRMQASRFRVFTNWTGQKMVDEIWEAHRLLKGRTVVTSVDGAGYVRAHPQSPKYLDPPYFHAGAGLYRMQMTLAGHLGLAAALRNSGKWILSYDDCPGVRELYSWAQCYTVRALYRFHQKAGKCARGDELIIVPCVPSSSEGAIPRA